MHLRVVARVRQFPIALDEPRLELGSHSQGLGQQRRADLADGGIERVEIQQVELGQQSLQERAEALAHGYIRRACAVAVSGFHDGHHLMGEGQAGQRGAQLAQRRLGDGNSADGRGLGAGCGRGHAHCHGFSRRAKHPGVIHFGEIVILGGQPEHGHRRDALIAELPRHVRRRHGLINGVRRAGKQSDLLAGDDGHGAGLG